MEQLQGVADQLGIDHTFLPVFGLMFVLYLVLSAVYLKPFQHIIENRRKKTQGTKDSAKDMLSEVEAKSLKYSESLKLTNSKVKKVLHEAEQIAKKEESVIMADSQAKAKDVVQAAVKQLEVTKTQILKDLEKDIPGVANEIAAKVLGRAI